MGKSYQNLQQKSNNGHENASSGKSTISNRRVWVRRQNGSPTTIMMGKESIVDDLKTAIHQKFPNSLGRYSDPCDIIVELKMESPRRIGNMKPSTRRSQTTRAKQVIGDKKGDAKSLDGLIDTGFLILELSPEKNVWEVLDDNFGGEMQISDALIIRVKEHSDKLLTSDNAARLSNDIKASNGSRELVPIQRTWSGRDSPHFQELHKPAPTYPARASQKSTDISSSPKPIGEGNNINGAPSSLHRRSMSHPPQSPVSISSNANSSSSQAVLLLPKNFSLGEQNKTKRQSVDEGLNPKHSNDLGIEKALVRKVEDDQQSQESLPNEKINHTAKNDPLIDTLDSKAQPKITRNLEDFTQQKQHRLESKGKPVGSTTFEKVLPSISVLVVEDNSINQAILGAFLRKHKVHYQIAKNGQEAVDKWRKGGFHLVLMDIQLPVKSGIEATKEIRYLEKVNRIGVFAQHAMSKSSEPRSPEIELTEKLDLNIFRSPVIIVALTASSNSSVDKKNALTAGCNDFLTKPVNLVWLQNKITEWGCMQALIDFDGWKFKGK